LQNDSFAIAFLFHFSDFAFGCFVALLLGGLFVLLVVYHSAKPQRLRSIKPHDCSRLMIYSARYPPIPHEQNVIKSGLLFLF